MKFVIFSDLLCQWCRCSVYQVLSDLIINIEISDLHRDNVFEIIDICHRVIYREHLLI